MKGKGLGKLYDRLTPDERFRLDVLARGDERESGRLLESCPRRSYTMTDVRFSWRWDAARVLTMVVLLDLTQHLSKLRMIDALRSGVLPYSTALVEYDAYLAYSDGRKAGSRHAWKRAGMKGEPPGWEDEEEAEENADLAMEEGLQALEARVEESANVIPELLGRLERKVAGEAFVVWQAFVRFCEEEIQLEPEKVLGAIFEPALENVRWLEDLAERLALEPERESVEEYQSTLSKAWNVQMARADVR